MMEFGPYDNEFDFTATCADLATAIYDGETQYMRLMMALEIGRGCITFPKLLRVSRGFRDDAFHMDLEDGQYTGTLMVDKKRKVIKLSGMRWVEPLPSRGWFSNWLK